MKGKEKNKRGILIIVAGLVVYATICIIVDYLEKRRNGIIELTTEADTTKEFSTSEETITEDYFNRWISDENKFPFVYETIYLNENSLQEYIMDDDVGEKITIELLRKELYMYSHQQNQSLCIWNDEDVYKAIYSYNRFQIAPYGLIKQILPKVKRLHQLTNYYGDELKMKDFKTIDTRIFRNIEKIYSLVDKPNHIQLITLGYGYVYPTIQLITINKENFGYIDSTIFYSIKQDESETIRIKGCLDEAFETLSIKEIHTFSNYSDTFQYDYKILESGKIDLLE